MKLVCNLLALALLAGCSHEIVTKEIAVEVRVPVAAPCMGQKPDEVVPLNQKLDQAQWKQLSPDQREALIGAQGLARKAYGDKLTVASAGCP